MSVVTRSDEDRIAIITVDNPPVNALSHAVREGLVTHVEAANSDDNIDAILIQCAGNTFIAGADITEFGKPPRAPHLPDVVNRIEASSKPLVAAIHGTAFGGGLEIALGCHFRIALSSAQIGTPEVKLGLLPGAGGTQRLPRLTDINTALDMIVTGAPVKATFAQEKGIIDRIAEKELLQEALEFTQQIIAGKAPIKRASELSIDASSNPPEVFNNYRKKIAHSTRGYFAPERCIQAVEAAVSLPFFEGLQKERALFMECMASDQSAALRHAFFAERKVSKVKGIDKSTPTRPIAKVGIIGAGTMGSGIAMNFLSNGIPVTLVEQNQEALDRGVGTMAKNYAATAKKGRITEAQMEAALALLNPTTSIETLKDCDLIIEAVFEKMDVKKSIFSKLDHIAKSGAILATNTSYLDVNEIASVTNRPHDVIGLHFFSPANIMRLLEIVRGAKTAKDALNTAIQLAKGIGKVGVVSGVCRGFIGNRMLEGYGREAGLLLLEGASPAEIDAALYEFGMPMGPMAMGDMAGLDIAYMLRQSMPAGTFDDKAYNVVNRLVEMDRKGQKTGAGYYHYEAGDRTPHPDDIVTNIIKEEAEKLGIKRRTISAEEIVSRCIYPLINVGAYILEEKIALRASDIDVVWMNGYGFPRYRGGPMHYADSIGLKNVLKTIEGYAQTLGTRWWQPSDLLIHLAKDGKSFADWDAENS